jgi:outer membrane protein assembly factor BamB
MPRISQWALAESLLIDGDHVICSPGGKLASVAALNKINGEIVWITESTGDKAGYGSPILVEHGGLRIILTMTEKAVIGVDADTGRLLFRDPYETEHDVNAMRPSSTTAACSSAPATAAREPACCS